MVPSPARIWAARAIALGADAIQIFAVPFFFGGAASPLNDALDVVVGAVLVLLVGWHFAFLPTFIAELVPMLNIFPTWTTAVLFVTRGRRVAQGG
ncbi:MAG TPA: hypothetical protein VGJ98_08890 [Candidatus Eisenbacteria bacterium]|jgi:hypothetical protein